MLCQNERGRLGHRLAIIIRRCYNARVKERTCVIRVNEKGTATNDGHPCSRGGTVLGLSPRRRAVAAVAALATWKIGRRKETSVHSAGVFLYFEMFVLIARRCRLYTDDGAL